VKRSSPRRFGIDHVIIRVMAWFSVGLLGSFMFSVLHAAFYPIQPIVGTAAPNVGASRYVLRSDESMIAEWYVMLGGQRPVYAEDYGWPFFAWSTWHAQVPGGRWQLVAGVPLSALAPRPGAVIPAAAPRWALPVVPRLALLVPAGAFYGLSAFALWCWFLHRRGRARARLGLCAHCGYGPWTGGSGCPECGASVSERGGRPLD